MKKIPIDKMLKEFLKEMKNIIAKKIPKKTCIAMYLFCPKNIGSEFMEIFLSSICPYNTFNSSWPCDTYMNW